MPGARGRITTSPVAELRSLFRIRTALYMVTGLCIYLAGAHWLGFYVLLPQRDTATAVFEQRLDECALLWVVLWSVYGWVFVARAGSQGAVIRGNIVAVIPLFLCSIAGVSKALRWLHSMPLWATACVAALGLFQGLALWSALLAQTYIWRRRLATGICLRCGYNLTGNVSGICPECGTRVHQGGAE